MDQNEVSRVVSAERAALYEMDRLHQTGIGFQCPLCGGRARLDSHEWYGYVSYCENDCFTSLQ
jgi:hypothetical protein